MSEELTQDISRKYDTKPTIETVLERLEDFRAAMEKRFDGVEKLVESVDGRVDRIEQIMNLTRADILELRADLKGFKAEVRGRFKDTA